MERRVLLAITLSFLVLFLYQSYLVPPPPADQPQGAAATSPQPAPAGVEAPAPPPDAVPPEEEAVVVGDAAEREITVDTDLVRAVFTNRGGRIKQWVLKQYRDERGEPLDLVPAHAGDRTLPFTLRVDDQALTSRLNESLYRVTGAEESAIHVTGEPLTLSFELERADGVRATKTFVIEPASYVVTFTADVRRNGETLNPRVGWGPGLGDDIARAEAGSFFSPNYTYPPQAIYQQDGDVERTPVTSLGAGTTVEGVFTWAGVDDHYFLSAVVDPPSPLRIEYTPVTAPVPGNAELTGRYVNYVVGFPAPPTAVKFFYGPKQFDSLQAVSPELTRAVYFGIFGWLAAPLLNALKWVHGFTANWGWAIIVLTILINLAMFPLRHKSVVSMRKMQTLQPRMKAIQERYAKYKITDPERQKMNQEVMELYRAEGVNPASGCLPMLLTLPFLFAFYSMLSQAIEIRGADFGGWITDLSTYDPLYITPLLMGLTMFWQQRITPTAADPTQAKVMMIMPFMFTFMFLWAPSGLVIYWLVSNLFAIGQQYFTNAVIGPPATVKPGSGAKDVKAPKGAKPARATSK